MRALKENARQGFWNGSLPPIGYRVVAADIDDPALKDRIDGLKAIRDQAKADAEPWTGIHRTAP